ncbi:hypothetical protein ETD86_42565 [Nonomuraea turkmeniaca]|uniref:UspA domain-containing protein n=1 Tax=Nonomuraea turkmeniaca TaxID=103838 RepID=A0A5S4F1F3_9ACTN|nr:universal stress protein [Nonomuraea turkmeniaca]TMR09686.1 hypothetical protein ETD86_42565 [Nonomuraea turkmeniaca]
MIPITHDARHAIQETSPTPSWTSPKLDASLIVLGPRGRPGLGPVLSGSISTRVMHSAARPTLAIPSKPLAAARRADR